MELDTGCSGLLSFIRKKDLICSCLHCSVIDDLLALEVTRSDYYGEHIEVLRGYTELK